MIQIRRMKILCLPCWFSSWHPNAFTPAKPARPPFTNGSPLVSGVDWQATRQRREAENLTGVLQCLPMPAAARRAVPSCPPGNTVAESAHRTLTTTMYFRGRARVYRGTRAGQHQRRVSVAGVLDNGAAGLFNGGSNYRPVRSTTASPIASGPRLRQPASCRRVRPRLLRLPSDHVRDANRALSTDQLPS